MAATERALELARAAAAAAHEKLASEVIALDVSSQLALTDVFVLASAPSERQVAAVVDEVTDVLRKEYNARLTVREGERDGRWVLLDFSDIVVHVMHEEERQYYQLERLWKDCPTVGLGE